MKRCTHCGVEKDLTCFRMRTQTRKGRQYKYPESKCRECENHVQKRRYSGVSDDMEFKIKNRARANKYRAENLDKILERQRKKRMTPAYSAYRQSYINANRDRINSKRKGATKRYTEKQIANVTDAYVRRQLSHPRKRQRITQESIEFKRIEILATRIEKKLKNEKQA